MQPLDRNASSVGCAAFATPTTTASPLGVTPARSVAVDAVPAARRRERRRLDRGGDAGLRPGIAPDAEIVERAQDLGVAAQQPGDQQREEREHHRLDDDQDQHLRRG